jgi:5-methyltetrahydropteroyltriglutamate--homocysteine methyltransferase
MATPEPLFRADHVGSLLRPPELLKARADRAAGTISAAELRRIEDAAIVDCIKLQEDAGMQSITDGEFRRENWWIYFIAALNGVEITDPTEDTAFQPSSDHGGHYVPKGVKVTGKVSGSGAIMRDHFDFIRNHTDRTPKITLPSPTRMVYYGGRSVVDQDVYPSMDDFWSDVATAYQAEIAALEAQGCTYIQIDDPVLTYFLDERIRGEMRAGGVDPDEQLVIYTDAINACISKRSPDTYLSLHLCRGNAASQWNAEGGYDRFAQSIFPKMNIDTWFLEYDDGRSGGFEPLRHIPEDRNVVLGLVSTKTGRKEDPSEIKSRIEQAAQFVSRDRLALSPQCGFASIDAGNTISFEDEAAKLKFVADIAAEVWS